MASSRALGLGAASWVRLGVANAAPIRARAFNGLRTAAAASVPARRLNVDSAVGSRALGLKAFCSGSQDPFHDLEDSVKDAVKDVRAVTPAGAITEEDVIASQTAWANAMTGISKVFLAGGDYVATARYCASELYGQEILYKPTRALSRNSFRTTADEVLSVFVGAQAAGNDKFVGDDSGSALNKGKGWEKVTHRNHLVEIMSGTSAIAMGETIFTCATHGTKRRVECTFGYKINDDGKMRIFLQHSSFPYTDFGAEDGRALFDKVRAVEPKGKITKEDVEAAQEAWSNAIMEISRTFLVGGDYVAAASYCAGELYGYGKSNVLFKPTKATKHPFRPTGDQALSYFVGSDAMRMGDGFDGEDPGFAINGGKGWSEVGFLNHKIEFIDDVNAIAMGSYVFTCASSRNETRVEFTFGYRINDDGKMRIFLHHSSVPYVPYVGSIGGAIMP